MNSGHHLIESSTHVQSIKQMCEKIAPLIKIKKNFAIFSNYSEVLAADQEHNIQIMVR